MATFESADPASLVSAEAAAPATITVTLSLEPDVDATSEDPAYWSIAQNSPTNGLTPTIVSVDIVGTTATIVTTEQTSGQSYRITAVTAGGFVAGSYADFTGAGPYLEVADWTSWGVRTWMQAKVVAAADATIRLTRDPFGTPLTTDWTIAAGESWASLDAMIAVWNVQLSGRAVVELVPDLVEHRAYVRVRTWLGVAYSIDWSYAGDGSLIRNRLGESGNVTGRASATTWTTPAPASWYSWHGATQIVRRSTSLPSSRRWMLAGTHAETTHGAVAGELGRVALDVTLRFGTPSTESAASVACLEALGTWLDELWSANGAGEPWALYHLEDSASTPDRWLVGFDADDVSVRPERVRGSRPDWLWDAGLSLEVEEAPW